jgi:hypothetical protein
MRVLGTFGKGAFYLISPWIPALKALQRIKAMNLLRSVEDRVTMP